MQEPPSALGDNGTRESQAYRLAVANEKLEGNIEAHALELKIKEQELHAMAQRVEDASHNEARRIAYDLHDGVAQTATATHNLIQALRNTYKTEDQDVKNLIEELAASAQQTIRDSRLTIEDLRPQVLEDYGLVVALHHKIVALREDGHDVTYAVSHARPGILQRCHRITEHRLLRIAQEGLKNAIRHSQATHIHVGLELRGSPGCWPGACLIISDNGIGFDTQAIPEGGPGEHVGVQSMHERIIMIGGTLTITSSRGGGTKIAALAPQVEGTKEALAHPETAHEIGKGES